MKNILAKLRKENGITQHELAEKLKVSRQSIIAIEAGKLPEIISRL
ncbi:MAG: helix-turn-helix domain-containing protein [Lachnospiraceae bacterium]|nr:helix-turn-helix domain-containing protein [Lachnospiraceae bacterium]